MYRRIVGFTTTRQSDGEALACGSGRGVKFRTMRVVLNCGIALLPTEARGDVSAARDRRPAYREVAARHTGEGGLRVRNELPRLPASVTLPNDSGVRYVRLRYTIVLNDFMANGAEGRILSQASTADVTLPSDDLDALVAYLSSQPQPVAAPNDNRITISEP